MANIPQDAERTVRAYLATSAPPCDFAAHLATYAPEALVPAGQTLLTRRSLDVRAYAATMADMASADSLAAATSFDWLEALTWRADGQGGTLAVRLRERVTGQEVTGVFRLEGEGLRLRGAYCGEPVADPAEVTARCQAELAALSSGDFAKPPLTGLAASFLRQYRPPAVPLLILPEARFTCQGRGDCCVASRWTIAVHGGVKAALEEVPWDDLGLPGPRFALRNFSRMAPTDHQHWQLHADAGGGCTALCDRKCSVHLSAGWQPIRTCNVFPFEFFGTPDGVCVTLSYTCLTVGEGQGKPGRDSEADIRQRLHSSWERVYRIGDEVLLAPDGVTVSWGAYRLVEEALLAILDDRRLGPITARLRQGHRLVAAVLERLPAGASREQAAELLAGPLPELPAGDPRYAEELAKLILGGESAEHGDVPLGGMKLAAWRQAIGRPLGEALDDEAITRYLRNLLFRKQGLVANGLGFLWGLLALAARLWEVDARYRSERDGRMPGRTLQLETARLIDRLFVHALPSAVSRFEPVRFVLAHPGCWQSLLEP